MTSRDHLVPVPSASAEPGDDIEIVRDLAFPELPHTMWQLTNTISSFPQELQELYYSLVDGLRRDAQHLPVGTIAAMQLERVAFYYVQIRYGEAHGGWTRQDRDALYRRYREASQDFAAHGHSKKINPEELHQIVSQHTAKIVANVLRQLPAAEAQPLYRKFAKALDYGASD
jgi:hypothetical protein